MLSSNGTSILKRHTTSALETKYDKLHNKTDLLTFTGMLQFMNNHIQISIDIAALKEEMLKPASYHLKKKMEQD